MGCPAEESCLACSVPLNVCLSLPIRNSMEGHNTGEKNGSVRILPGKTRISRNGINEESFLLFSKEENNELMCLMGS